MKEFCVKDATHGSINNAPISAPSYLNSWHRPERLGFVMSVSRTMQLVLQSLKLSVIFDKVVTSEMK